jgi:L-malate glycosyltransferase
MKGKKPKTRAKIKAKKKVLQKKIIKPVKKKKSTTSALKKNKVIKTVSKSTAPVKKKSASQKRKILVINYEYPPLGGGGGVATYDLAVEWAKTCQVDVLTSSFKGLPKKEVVEGVTIYRVPILFRASRDTASFISMLSYLFFGFFKGISLARKNRYNVINTHFAVPSGPLGHIISKFFGIPNILSLHGGDIYDPSKKSSPHKSFFFKRVVRFILNRADRIVAQSNNTRDNAQKYYHPKKAIQVVPLPFHPPVIGKFSREEAGYSRNDFLIISIGRVVKRKAYDLLIRALFQIRDNKVKLVIVGDGPEKQNLQNLTDYLGLRDRVSFTGFISSEEKYGYLSKADLFALTSLHEGFGIVFMEAMYCGLPIVCTNNGGQTDFIFSGKNGLLLNVGDIGACAENIDRLRNDKKLYRKCSKNNKNDVKNFYAGKVAAQYTTIFSDVITERQNKK